MTERDDRVAKYMGDYDHGTLAHMLVTYEDELERLQVSRRAAQQDVDNFCSTVHAIIVALGVVRRCVPGDTNYVISVAGARALGQFL
jgi:hypothetical protein